MTKPERLPNFFLAGAPKSGTTSLYRYLDQHPQIYMSPIKEPHYFSEEIRFENYTEAMQELGRSKLEALTAFLQGPMDTKCSAGPVARREDYLKLFQHVREERAIGEASVCYLWSKTAPVNIAAKLPAAKILVMLRNPADRAFSQYLHMLTFAESHISFREYIFSALDSRSTKIGKLYPFLEFGYYARQLRRYLECFPREQLGVYFYEDYERDPEGVVGRIFEFLGVDSGYSADVSERHMTPRVPRSYGLARLAKWVGRMTPVKAPALRSSLRRLVYRNRETLMLNPADRASLIDLYRDDVRDLSSLLDMNLDHWLRVSANCG